MNTYYKWLMQTAISALLLSVGLHHSLALADTQERPFGERSIFSERAITERTAPVGQVCLKGENCQQGSASTDSGLQVVAATNKTPESIYQSKCLVCHASGAAGAPRLGEAGDWTTRITKGLDVLTKNAIQGINAMPPKGMCMDCTDDEIKAVVKYMLDKSQ